MTNPSPPRTKVYAVRYTSNLEPGRVFNHEAPKYSKADAEQSCRDLLGIYAGTIVKKPGSRRSWRCLMTALTEIYVISSPNYNKDHPPSIKKTLDEARKTCEHYNLVSRELGPWRVRVFLEMPDDSVD